MTVKHDELSQPRGLIIDDYLNIIACAQSKYNSKYYLFCFNINGEFLWKQDYFSEYKSHIFDMALVKDTLFACCGDDGLISMRLKDLDFSY